MNKITAINLNGNAYQLEEAGYVTLSGYLSQATTRLAENPDQKEIIADLEQAIADKFQRFLSKDKSVVTADEVAIVIKEMGPVDGDEQTHTDSPATGPKRLYRIEKGEILGGVATGLAAYFDIDVVLIRIIFVALAIFTSGAFGFAYFIAWMIIPLARTQEQEAAASGAAFSAEQLIARAKAEYSKLDKRSITWKQEWRTWKKQQKNQTRDYWRSQTQTAQYYHRSNSIGQLMGILVFSFFVWLGYHHIPAIHDFLNAVWNLWLRTIDLLSQIIAAHSNNAT